MPTPIDNHVWVDILEPLAPPPLFSPLQIVMFSIVLLSLVTLVLFWRWRQPRQRALRQLQLLHREKDQPGADLRQLGFRLRYSLCSGLQVCNLTDLIVAAEQQRDWLVYVTALTQLCYQPQPPTANQLTELIQQAHGWLHKSRLHDTRS